eukprot:5919667-Pleurochrysis_carterae.AAC.5
MRSKLGCERRGDLVGYASDAINFASHHVPILEPERWLSKAADPARRASKDQISRLRQRATGRQFASPRHEYPKRCTQTCSRSILGVQ